MKILTVCCGAVGAYFTGRLSQHGVDVSVTVRSGFDEVKQSGFHVQSRKGDFIFRPAQVLHNASEFQGEADWVIFTGKALQTVDSAALLGPAVGRGTRILLIQNGLGIEDGPAAAFPHNELFSAIAYVGVTRISPNQVMHQGSSHLIIGRFGGGESEEGRAICRLFEEAGVTAEYTQDIAFFRWKKLLWNLPFNSISVLGGGLLTNEMVDGGEMEALARDLMQEVILTAKADGVDLPENLAEESIRYTRDFPPYRTSMLVDYEHGRPLEVDAIVGSVLQRARKHGVSAPHIETIYGLLRALDGKSCRK